MPANLLITNLDDTTILRAVGAKVREWILTKELPPNGTEEIDGTKVIDLLKQAGLQFVPSVTKVVVHQSTDSVLHIVLSHKGALQSGLAAIEANPEGYNIQPHYREFVRDREANGGNFVSRDQVKAFYDFRIGDYTLQHCM